MTPCPALGSLALMFKVCSPHHEPPKGSFLHPCPTAVPTLVSLIRKPWAFARHCLLTLPLPLRVCEQCQLINTPGIGTVPPAQRPQEAADQLVHLPNAGCHLGGPEDRSFRMREAAILILSTLHWEPPKLLELQHYLESDDTSYVTVSACI